MTSFTFGACKRAKAFLVSRAEILAAVAIGEEVVESEAATQVPRAPPSASIRP